MRHKLHAATNTQRQNLYFYLYDVQKTILDLECVKIVCTDNVCKMKTMD